MFFVYLWRRNRKAVKAMHTYPYTFSDFALANGFFLGAPLVSDLFRKQKKITV